MSEQTPPAQQAPQQAPAEQAAEQFTDFEQQFLDVIGARYPVSEGTGSAAGSESTGTPESEPAGAPGDDESAEGPGTESPETAGAGEGEAPGGEDGQSSQVFTLSGHDYTPDQIAQAIQVHDWFARLDPGQVQAIDALMSGQYRLAPAAEAAGYPEQTQPVGSPGQTPSPAVATTDDEGEWLDPRAQQAIAEMQAQINQISQNVNANLQPVVQHQMNADYQVRLDQINAASSNFKDRYSLDDDQMRTLESAIVEAQVLPSLANRFGSIPAGMNAALEMFFWTTPDYRDPFLQKQQSAAAAESAANEADNVRKQQLTALSASGGSAPRREPVPSTPEDRHAAMTAEIAAAMNGSGTVQ